MNYDEAGLYPQSSRELTLETLISSLADFSAQTLIERADIILDMLAANPGQALNFITKLDKLVANDVPIKDALLTLRSQLIDLPSFPKDLCPSE